MRATVIAVAGGIAIGAACVVALSLILAAQMGSEL